MMHDTLHKHLWLAGLAFGALASVCLTSTTTSAQSASRGRVVMMRGNVSVPLRNFDYLARCYDILKLDPIDVASSGSAKTRSVFALSKRMSNVGDGHDRRPVGTRHRRLTSGSLTERTRVLGTAYDFKQSFDSSVGGGLDALAGAVGFSASRSVTEVQQTTQTNKTTRLFTEVYVQSYELELIADLPSERPVLDELFVHRVQALPAEPDLDAYLRFIDQFGTHFSTKVVFGGRLYRTTDVSQSTLMKYKSRGEKIAVTANASFKRKVSGNVSVSQASENVQRFDKEVSSSDSGVRHSGGTFNDDKSAWAGSVRADPAPVELRLAGLHTVLTPQYFPQDEYIEDKAAILEAAVNVYLARNGRFHTKPQRNGIEVQWTTQYQPIWNALGLQFFRPLGLPGFVPLGDFAQPASQLPQGRTLVAQNRIYLPDAPPLLVHPVRYEWVWDDRGTGSAPDVSVWRPVPPPGYRALGLVAKIGYDTPPPLQDVYCAHQDFVADAAVSPEPIWRGGATHAGSLWALSAASGVPAGSFDGHASHARPERARVGVFTQSALQPINLISKEEKAKHLAQAEAEWNRLGGEP